MNWYADDALLATLTGEPVCYICHRGYEEVFPVFRGYRRGAYDYYDFRENVCKTCEALWSVASLSAHFGTSTWRTVIRFKHREYVRTHIRSLK
jgi:hypothetical protein